jgi:hypothetical protein
MASRRWRRRRGTSGGDGHTTMQAVAAAACVPCEIPVIMAFLENSLPNHGLVNASERARAWTRVAYGQESTHCHPRWLGSGDEIPNLSSGGTVRRDETDEWKARAESDVITRGLSQTLPTTVRLEGVSRVSACLAPSRLRITASRGGADEVAPMAIDAERWHPLSELEGPGSVTIDQSEVIGTQIGRVSCPTGSDFCALVARRLKQGAKPCMTVAENHLLDRDG